MDLEKLYCEVKHRMETVDFNKLWDGFAPLKFALYNDSECFFDGNYIEKTDEFLANTSILYNGEWIAIWNMQEEVDPAVLTSKIVHEMFHGFQRMNNECRFPNEMEALYKYRYEEENLGIKLEENHLLCSLSNRFDKQEFEKLLKIRKYRSNTFEYEYYYEACCEQIEGAANYVELNCLRQLSPELFEKKISTMRAKMTDSCNLLPVRMICYDIGALLLFVMAENDIEFDNDFTDSPFSVEILKGVEEQKYVPQFSIKEQVDAYYSRADETIDSALKKNSIVTETPCELLAVNVYDAVYHRDHIISRYFVMYGSEEKNEIQYGNFMIETKECGKLTKIYRI